MKIVKHQYLISGASALVKDFQIQAVLPEALVTKATGEQQDESAQAEIRQLIADSGSKTTIPEGFPWRQLQFTIKEQNV